MYLHLGQETIIRTRDFLAGAQQRGEVVNVTQELPKSFIITVHAGEKRPHKRTQSIFISQISAATLKKRSGYIEDIRNI